MSLDMFAIFKLNFQVPIVFECTGIFLFHAYYSNSLVPNS